MSGWVAGAIVVGTVASAYSSNKATKAAKSAAQAQTDAANRGIEEQRSQFDKMQELLSPYVSAGQPALRGQQDILGLGGQAAQQQAISGIQNSPMFGAMAQQGENAILQNASATGGLRGGNVQGALAQFRPALLNSLIDQQYQRLGGLATMGQNSAAGVGVAGMQTGNQISGLYQQQGSAQAGADLAQGRAAGQTAGAISGGFGQFAGYMANRNATPPPETGSSTYAGGLF